MAKRKRRFRVSAKKLWVFAQYPVAPSHLVIPVLATSREEAIRILEADPQRLGKPLTPTIVVGQPGFTDGERDFLIFDDQEQFMRFLSDQLGNQN